MTERQLEELMRQYEKLLYTICFHMVRDAHTAEDLVQETFLSAWLHADSCPAGAEKAWLCRIALNKSKDHLKSAYSRRVSACENPEESAPPRAPDARGVESLCELRADAARAAEELNALDEPYRAVSILYFARGMSAGDIAAALGRMPKTVQTQLYRAKRKLRRSLAFTRADA